MDILLLILRIAIAVSLYTFLGILFLYIVRDLRQAEEAQLPYDESRLVVATSDGTVMHVGQAFPLKPVTTLGRSPVNDIVIPDTFASLDHAAVLYRDGQWWLDDRDSRNGTVVNDIPVEDEIILSSGDMITIGHIKFRFELTRSEPL